MSSGRLQSCCWLLALGMATAAHAAPPVSFSEIGQDYDARVLPIVKQFCNDCHSTADKEGELDLEQFAKFADVRRDPRAWIKVVEMLKSGEMPPEDADQPTAEQKQLLSDWAKNYLDAEAKASAGDPGPVVLRRLSNAEYTYTIQDLTGVPLEPAREFPIDGAAGEGFTNTGSALVMSPALFQKYLDAGKEIAGHAVLVPSGIHFSQHTSQSDQTTELLGRIQAFYANFTEDGGGVAVDLQGVKFDTNRGGLLPLARYLSVTLAEREALASGAKTIAAVAAERKLSPKYLGLLWKELSADVPDDGSQLAGMRQRWRETKTDDPSKLVAEIAEAQKTLWKFNSIGHVGRVGGPTRWLEPVGSSSALVAKQEIRWKLPEAPDGRDVVFYLATSDAGDGNDGDYVTWKNFRLEASGQPALPLRDVAALQQRVGEIRLAMLGQTAQYLTAAAAVNGENDVAKIAAAQKVDARTLQTWVDYLANGQDGGVKVEGHFTEKLNDPTYKSVTGWGSSATPLVIANSSDEELRIPGLAKAHSVLAHPSPTLFAAVGWQSPIDGTVRVEASIGDAHDTCGNGFEWRLQQRSSGKAATLAQGEVESGAAATVTPMTIEVRRGQLLSLIIGARNNDHVCDTTAIQLVVTETGGQKRSWDLTKDVSPNIQAANPHADLHGHDGVWHFYQGEMAKIEQGGAPIVVVPSGSALAGWLGESDAAKRGELAQRVQEIAVGAVIDDPTSPDAQLQAQLRTLPVAVDVATVLKDLPPSERFGRHPLGEAIDASDLVVRAPEVIEFRLPAELARWRELVGTVELDPQHGRDGTTQAQVSSAKPDVSTVTANVPILVRDDSPARERIEGPISRYTNLFPPALCYARIVPVDEVVTLTLYHREDDQLRRLMLDDQQVAELNRLWDELLFVSQEPLKLAVVFEQLSEFATQDRPDLVKAFEPLRKPINDRAAAFQQRMLDNEPAHVDAVVKLAGQAYRRPLTEREDRELHELYAKLRAEELPHDEAVRLLVARVFASPAFLYRLEQPGPEAAAVNVSDVELASRLSYFLWSTMPDDELRELAVAGKLHDEATLKAQTQRMLRDQRTRRLAIEFACQWLHVRDFHELDEKSEQHFPTFNSLRGDMYEESIRFFADLVQSDGRVLDVLDADYTFLNGNLAKHYGVPNVDGDAWRKVEGVRRFARGGVLTQATVLAKQSGASRTSPILRGNWVSETLLGERLPRPPKDVPQLPEEVPQGLTERQLIEKHSSDAACAKCHARIDHYGFVLEQYDAIGRLRDKDAGGHAIDVKSQLPDGTPLVGVDGLRDYLLTTRRDDFVRQFCRKLLGYALGRSVQLSDQPLIDKMMADLAASDYRFSAAALAIVLSDQFRQIRGQKFAGLGEGHVDEGEE